MTFFWWLNSGLWGALFAYTVRGAWRAAWGRTSYRNDPIYLAAATTSLMMAGFSLRWLIAPDNLWAWQMLYGLSAANALYIAALVRAYGRGPNV